MKTPLGFALIALSLFLSACNLSAPVAPATETPLPQGSPAPASETLVPILTPDEEGSPTPEFSPTAELTATVELTDTEGLTSTPGVERTPGVEGTPGVFPTASGSECLPSNPDVALQAGDFAAYPQAVLEFLNAGGTIESLDQGLYSGGVANQPVAVTGADLTGDDLRDMVVSIYDPLSELIPPGGKLLIYVCQAGQYRLAHEQDSQEGWGALGIRYLQDLDADGVAELVASAATCGASACFEDLQVLAWDGSNFVNRLETASTDLPHPDTQLEDPDGDGIFDIIVTGSGFGSVGAGPQRSLTRVWVLDPASENWILAGETRGESNYRIHVLLDAESSALVGDYEQAVLLYGRVIQDATLEEWMDPETERANLAAYALFKTGVIYLLQGMSDFAQATFDQLEQDYPAGAAGHAYVEMAQEFQAAYAAEESVLQGCLAARDYIAQHPEEILNPLGSVTFGYANPDFTPEDICPWE